MALLSPILRAKLSRTIPVKELQDTGPRGTQLKDGRTVAHSIGAQNDVRMWQEDESRKIDHRHPEID